MLTVVVFGLVVIIMICGGMLLARLATAAKSKGSCFSTLAEYHRDNLARLVKEQTRGCYYSIPAD